MYICVFMHTQKGTILYTQCGRKNELSIGTKIKFIVTKFTSIQCSPTKRLLFLSLSI